MRHIRDRFAFSFGTCLLLAVMAAVSIGLNTNLRALRGLTVRVTPSWARRIATGRGYREINEPGSPWHDHFPPGYPATLALLWRFASRSVVVAHVFSASCTVVAVLLAWRWFRMIYPPRTALILGLALAINWTWARVGGSIQSEPWYMLWELLVVVIAVQAGRYNTSEIGVVLGLVLATSILIRHVGVCLTLAVVLDLGLRRRWKASLLAGLITVLLILPWVIWLAAVHHHPQLSLFTTDGLMDRIAGQAIFYYQRLPDQVAGPFVEVATVLQRSPAVATAANLWAAMVMGVIVWGWVRILRTHRRRLAGIIAFTTLSLLLIWPFTEAGRFLIPIVPVVLVGLTEGLASVITQARLKRPRDWAVAIVLAISVPYPVYCIINGRAEAQRQSHAQFDAACRWIAGHATQPGPILSRHPGEVFWQTGHTAIEPNSSNPDAIDRLIDRFGVTYLLIDDERYINAGLNPLTQYVEQYSNRTVFVWGSSHGSTSVRVFEIRRSK